MEIKNVRVYGLEESIIRSGYPMQTGTPINLDYDFEGVLKYSDDYNTEESWEKDQIRANKLAKTPSGSGHNNFLKGIIVQFDLKYTQYFTPQLQRYHWVDIVSSQSKMHSLTKIIDVSTHCNKYVLRIQADVIDTLIAYYNEDIEYPCKRTIWIPETSRTSEVISLENKQELFQYIISNLPMGYEMWMAISTNYLQLKTIYNQRKTHKLYDWKDFCKCIETLPMSELITGK